jgi:TRAP-type C4-dicarboxylate transport system permease small subunit
MPLTHWIFKFYKLLHKTETGLLITLLLSMIVIAVVQIVMRNFFDSGLFWAESYVRISVLWVALLGAMIGSRSGKHVAIDFLVLKMSEKYRLMVRRITDLFTAVLCFIIAYHSSVFIHSEYQDGGLAFAKIPNWFCELIIPITFAVIACRYLVAAVFNLRQQVTE